jgi:hypothetical protein
MRSGESYPVFVGGSSYALAMVNWGDVPTWLAVLGAFLGGGAALWRLRLQRIQLADQTRLQERLQANMIDVAAHSVDGAKSKVLPADASEPVHLVTAANGSNRPIREVACKIVGIRADETIRHERMADVYGEMMPFALGSNAQVETFVPQELADTKPVLRAGHTAGFAWGFTVARYPRCSRGCGSLMMLACTGRSLPIFIWRSSRAGTGKRLPAGVVSLDGSDSLTSGLVV